MSHMAAMHGLLGLMGYLLENNADVMLEDIDGNLPVHYAVDFKRDEILALIT